jgi:hypothetical protein
VTEFENLYPSLAAVFDGGRLGDTPESRLGEIEKKIVSVYKQGDLEPI